MNVLQEKAAKQKGTEEEAVAKICQQFSGYVVLSFPNASFFHRVVKPTTYYYYGARV